MKAHGLAFATVAKTLIAVLGWHGVAHANGRFPSAQYAVIGPGRGDDLLAVRATFGLVVSDDGGRRFRFLCEEAFEYRDGYDPSLAWTQNGTLLVGVEDGLQASATLCDPRRRLELQGQYVVDLTNDPAGRVVLAALRSRDVEPVMRVARSDDGGLTFDVPRDGLADTAPLTVDIAPSDAMTVYATALAHPGTARDPALLRSADGGRSFTRTRAVFPGVSDVYLAGVDARDSRRLYLRGRLRTDLDGGPDAGSALFVSDDGGDTARELTRTVGPMAGFALSDDGAHLWIGGPDPRDGLQVRDGDGPFRTLSTEPVNCLRWHAGALYLCGVLGATDVVLWRSRDLGATRESLVRVGEILPPPPSCATGSVVSGFCADRWISIRSSTLAQLRDGGTADASPDAPSDAPSPAPPSPPTGCGACAVPVRQTSRNGLWALALAAALRRRRLTRATARGSSRAR